MSDFLFIYSLIYVSQAMFLYLKISYICGNKIYYMADSAKKNTISKLIDSVLLFLDFFMHKCMQIYCIPARIFPLYMQVCLCI